MIGYRWAAVGRRPPVLVRWMMEALFFLIDSVVMLVVVYYGLMDERRPRNTPMRSPFRYFEGGRSSGIVAQELARKERERIRSGSGIGHRP